MAGHNAIRELYAVHLSKSRFTTGLQCDKRLWLSVHEKDAPELETDPALQAIFDRGHRVGEVARTYIPGGVLIDLPYHQVRERVVATERALRDGAKVIYEASFLADDVFVAVDILHRRGRHWTVTEVKSTCRVKDEHIPDAAVQTHVARRSGLDVSRTEVMHLNRACRFPDLEDLFVRADVTARVEDELPEIPREARRQLRVLRGPEPDVDPGDHCTAPYDCPFIERCWPKRSAHHVSTLYGMSTKRIDRLLDAGIESIHDLPDDLELGPIPDRQRRAVQEGRLIVEPGLKEALAQLDPPVAYLDFETIALPIPAWDGCHPYDSVPVQFSCHVEDAAGTLRHQEWLADGAGDPRPALAEALVRALRGAKTIVAYNAGFELGCIQDLRVEVRDFDGELARAQRRVVDLLPIVREHVYHPDFGGSFSLKHVAPALVPSLRYDDLAISNGEVASVELERLLFRGDQMQSRERETLRRALLEYCRVDTLALVQVVERLRDITGRRP
jgi:predicted RecB family nuclease